MNSILLKLAQMNNQKAMILAFIATATFYFMFFDSGSSFDQRLAQLQTQLDEQNKKVKESEVALKKLEQIRSSISSLHEQLKIVSNQLPSEVKASEILKTVDILARSAGVSVKSTEPRAIVKENIVEKIPLHVKLQGTYSEITMFLYYISIMERITRINNFSLANVSVEEEARVKTGSLNFEGDIVSYRYIAETSKFKVSEPKPTEHKTSEPKAPEPEGAKL